MRLSPAQAGADRRLTCTKGPHVQLLDARAADLDEPELRAWARGITAQARVAHVSRSYRYPYALVACHSEFVGVDIERVQPLDPVFLASIQTPSERRMVIAAEGPDRDAAVASLWSGKEALAKALGDALSYDPRRLESPVRWPEGRCGRWRAEALAGIDGHVGWVCWAVA